MDDKQYFGDFFTPEFYANQFAWKMYYNGRFRKRQPLTVDHLERIFHKAYRRSLPIFEKHVSEA